MFQISKRSKELRSQGDRNEKSLHLGRLEKKKDFTLGPNYLQNYFGVSLRYDLIRQFLILQIFDLVTIRKQPENSLSGRNFGLSTSLREEFPENSTGSEFSVEDDDISE